MIRTTYICDHCLKESADPNFLTPVQLTIGTEDKTYFICPESMQALVDFMGGIPPTAPVTQ